MKRLLISCLVLLLFQLSCTDGSNVSTGNRDVSLIIPGKAAEGYTIGQNITATEFNNSTDKEPPPLQEVLGIKKFPDIPYDSIIYHKNKSIIFIRHNIITAIAGLNAERRVTDSAVKLSDGADSFVLNYGNSGMEIIRKDKHRIYLYRSLGVAVFDDHNDDSIDMYIVFIPLSEP